ncbi:MAG: fimbrial chaperone protein [Oleiphilaceae bacterium]|jgi:fimbrial chaperone protein
MYKTAKIILTSFILISLLQSYTAKANLLISPLRVAINDRERSAQVILINTGDESRSYRIGWVQKKALALGGYQDLNEEESANFPTASQMFRMSPKQVTLAPNQRQVIKMAARRPKGLADGEYRSHLKFTVLPKQIDETTVAERGIVLNLMLNYTIPVILRQGPTEVDVSISEGNIVKSIVNDKIKYDIAVTMSRSGPSSAHGSLYAYWQPNNGGEETRLGILNSVNFYQELSQKTFTINWQKPDIPPVNGRLRITYEGKKEFQGVTLAEKYFNL